MSGQFEDSIERGSSVISEAAYANEIGRQEEADPEVAHEKAPDQEILTQNERDLSFIAMGAMFLAAYLMLV